MMKILNDAQYTKFEDMDFLYCTPMLKILKWGTEQECWRNSKDVHETKFEDMDLIYWTPMLKTLKWGTGH
jgi:hypothetical protein